MWLAYRITNSRKAAVNLGHVIRGLSGTGVFFRILDVSVTDWSGKELPSHLSDAYGGSFAAAYLRLEPGEEFNQRLLLQRWIRIDVPGIYNVSLRQKSLEIEWLPEVRTKLRVIPPDQARIKAATDDLVTRLGLPSTLPKNSHARHAVLNEIRSAVAEAEALIYPETLPALRRLLEARFEPFPPMNQDRFPYDYQVRDAIRAIEKALGQEADNPNEAEIGGLNESER